MTKVNAKKECKFVGRLLQWFSRNARDFPWRHETDPYHVLVAEKLLQQTTYGHVLKVYKLFLRRFPDIESLAKADVSAIEATIRRLGFQRQRAKQFKEMANSILSSFGGKIPSSREELLKLNGIGDYVANAVLCFAFNKDQPIVDVNVRRVLGRYFGWSKVKDEELSKRLEKQIPRGRAKEFNWGIIDFSALICSRKPKCPSCFFNDTCQFYNSVSRSETD